MLRFAKRIVAALDRLRYLRRGLAFPGALKAVSPKRFSGTLALRLKRLNKTVYVRTGTTDLQCLEKVFLNDEYRVPFALSPRVIVDAGANIGMAAVYFARQYPEARIVAIEPEPLNFAMLQRNCADLPNVMPVQAALWSSNSPLEIEDLDVEAWTFRIIESGAKKNGETKRVETRVPAITIPDIQKRLGVKQIDLLKIDIEGAELPLFSENCDEWLDEVKVIAIELHDRIRPGCARAFFSALAKRDFHYENQGENVFISLQGKANIS